MVLSLGGLRMASGVISELVLFIASLLIAGVIAGGLYAVTQDISDGINVKGEHLAYSLKLDFAIINDAENIPTESGAYVFYVKNTGKVSFMFDENTVVVFIDGNLIPPSNLTFTNLNDSSSSMLYPYDIGSIHVNTSLSSGYHKITIVVENGEKRSLVFKV
ncbi:flagellar protein G [Palaeococcus sp. (in: euryarchaeotes)]